MIPASWVLLIQFNSPPLSHHRAWLLRLQKAGKDVSMHVHDERALLAFQGPAAAPGLQKLVKDDLSKMYFGQFKHMDISGMPCWVTRTG